MNLAPEDALPRGFGFASTNCGLRKPPNLEVLDSESGKIIATLPTAGMTDDMAFDPTGKRIYVACTEFAAVYSQKDADHYETIAKIPTKSGAGTSFWSPELNRYYVGAPAHDNEEAAILVFEPQP